MATNLTISIQRRQGARQELAGVNQQRQDAKAKGQPDPFEGQPEDGETFAIMSLPTESGGRGGQVFYVPKETGARMLGAWPEKMARLATAEEISAMHSRDANQRLQFEAKDAASNNRRHIVVESLADGGDTPKGAKK